MEAPRWHIEWIGSYRVFVLDTDHISPGDENDMGNYRFGNGPISKHFTFKELIVSYWHHMAT